MTVEADRSVEGAITAFVQDRTKTELAADADLFATGLVSSLFAMELLVHLEQTFAVTVDGPDLKLDNFRTVDAMAALVRRLKGGDR
ncbi:acyl carrier protein [Kitasatospora sp. NPDC048239]|uniref:acyl carrier protein n=1 Tax=unclassified Kitasatospora TaxID=2633591 RepID=UPI003710B4C8